jgi:membrane AbrB-like protein
LLGLPAGWLSGGLAAVVAASLGGVNTGVPTALSTPAFFVLGLYAGSGVSPETIRQMQTWPASFVLLAVSMAALIGSSYWLLSRRFGWDRDAALLSALPGALSFVMAAAERLSADMKKVAFAQSIRVFMLVELVPLAAYLVGHSLDEGPPIAAAKTMGFGDLALLVAAGLAAALAFDRLRLPGAWLLGGLIGCAGLLLGGVIEGRLPAFLVVPGTIVIAAITGSRFRPGDHALLPRLVGPSLAAFAIAAAISVASAALVAQAFGISFVQALLAFAPGAQEAVVILAFAMGFDPAYVAAHHVVRFLALAAIVPLLVRWLGRRGG